MLPVGAIGVGPLREEGRADQLLAAVVGVVVLDLVIVPHVEPRRGGVRGLERGIGLVLGVAIPVLGERAHVAALVPAYPVRVRGVLVDVVAEKHDEIEILGRHVAPGRVVTVIPPLAARDGEVEGGDLHVGSRRGARATDHALLAERAEAIPIPPAGSQARGLGVHAVRPRLIGRLHAPRGDVREALVARDLPAHLDEPRQITAHEARPQHHAVWSRMARGHAE